MTFHTAEPRKDLITEGVKYFQLMVECVGDENNILLRDKVNAKWMLQLGIISNAVLIAEAMQVFWVVIGTDHVTRTRQCFHVDSSNGG